MDRQYILRTLHEDAAELTKMGIKSLALFGSMARGDATSTSDVDILVTFSHTPVTFDAYKDVNIYLEDRLNCPVDLVVSEALHPRVKMSVQQDAIYVA